MLRFTLTAPNLKINALDPSLAVLARFQEEAGKLIVGAVREILGTDEIYSLNPVYAASKPKRKGYRPTAGKPVDQPLIFTGEMYDAVHFRIEGAVLIIEVDESRASAADGFDYAEKWEQMTQFLEKGFEKVEPMLPALMEKILIEVFGKLLA
jgi:hypothetical protein